MARRTKNIKLGTLARPINLHHIKFGVQFNPHFSIIEVKEVDDVSIQDYELRSSMKAYQHKYSVLNSVVSFELVQRIGTIWLTHVCNLDLSDWHVYNKYAMSVSHGYIQVVVNGKKYLLHRLLLNAPDDKLVDHIDGAGINNQRLNLRLGTTYENSQNKKGPNKGSKSGILGVTWHVQNQKWQTRVVIGPKTYSLGCYYDLETAKKAAQEFRSIHLPFHTEVKNVPI